MRDPKKVYVANGEQAEVIDVTPTSIIARLSSPDRVIVIPRSNRSADDEKPDTGATDNDESEKESTGTGCSWELGYVVSVHKSQGSDWPIVIVMLDEHNSASMVQSRNWLYTAVSRAKKVCYTVGKRSVADSICHRDGLRRKTFLTELIREGMAEFEQAEATEDEYQRFVSEQNLMAEILEGVC